jgi:hypothetical protein
MEEVNLNKIYYIRGRYVFQVVKWNTILGEYRFLGFIFAKSLKEAEMKLKELSLPETKIEGTVFVRNLGLESKMKKFWRKERCQQN